MTEFFSGPNPFWLPGREGGGREEKKGKRERKEALLCLWAFRESMPERGGKKEKKKEKGKGAGGIEAHGKFLYVLHKDGGKEERRKRDGDDPLLFFRPLGSRKEKGRRRKKKREKGKRERRGFLITSCREILSAFAIDDGFGEKEKRKRRRKNKKKGKES